ncbi:MAG: nuclear transport factor 2 family protein [Acidobacteriota bacterium]|nr:nuclear transport factor 2 family protein [Acidobacteriota bacterium]
MQLRRSSLPTLLYLIAAVLPFALAAQNGPGDGSEVLRADERFNQAVETRDRELFASLIDKDATFLGGGVTQGREAIVAAWAGFFAEERTTVLSWKPHSVEISASGDLAYTIGDYKLSTRGEDGAQKLSTGTYVSIWKRHDDGSWKVVVDGGTPPQPAAAVPPD